VVTTVLTSAGVVEVVLLVSALLVVLLSPSLLQALKRNNKTRGERRYPNRTHFMIFNLKMKNKRIPEKELQGVEALNVGLFYSIQRICFRIGKFWNLPAGRQVGKLGNLFQIDHSLVFSINHSI
jgi:hypothetical protein